MYSSYMCIYCIWRPIYDAPTGYNSYAMLYCPCNEIHHSTRSLWCLVCVEHAWNSPASVFMVYHMYFWSVFYVAPAPHKSCVKTWFWSTRLSGRSYPDGFLASMAVISDNNVPGSECFPFKRYLRWRRRCEKAVLVPKVTCFHEYLGGYSSDLHQIFGLSIGNV